eukprot:TRINITY_DN1861_c0_g1_i2.p1 TRINITY_DN1861_c0_g1~~TRINITY_DN1861_c0_g1_i2.p1  ORF type:complete len:329 (-),score=67.85 TRINITY_DN1861_c0_g1_i2:1071-2057(-)
MTGTASFLSSPSASSSSSSKFASGLGLTLTSTRFEAQEEQAKRLANTTNTSSLALNEENKSKLVEAKVSEAIPLPTPPLTTTVRNQEAADQLPANLVEVSVNPKPDANFDDDEDDAEGDDKNEAVPVIVTEKPVTLEDIKIQKDEILRVYVTKSTSEFDTNGQEYVEVALIMEHSSTGMFLEMPEVTRSQHKIVTHEMRIDYNCYADRNFMRNYLVDWLTLEGIVINEILTDNWFLEGDIYLKNMLTNETWSWQAQNLDEYQNYRGGSAPCSKRSSNRPSKSCSGSSLSLTSRQSSSKSSSQASPSSSSLSPGSSLGTATSTTLNRLR